VDLVLDENALVAVGLNEPRSTNHLSCTPRGRDERGCGLFGLPCQARAVNTLPAFPPQSPRAQLLPELAPRPQEGVFDKITMSFFEGTPLGIALRDCQLMAFAIVGVALEVGIEPTVRHGADLGYVPVVVADACGSGNLDAGKRSLESLAFAGDAIITDTDSFGAALRAP
jgi:nicotinamidase-related amidase